MRVLVTGGSGFIGTNLCDALLRDGVSFKNIDAVPPRNPAHHSFWQAIDICDAPALGAAVAEFSPEIIFHLAARTDLNGSAVGDYPANVTGVENIITAANAVPGLRRVLFASSRLVCKIGYAPTSEIDYCPTTPYGESKVLGEGIVRHLACNAAWNWAIFRPTSIWGPWFGVPYKLFFDAVARGRYVHPKGAQISKSFGYVENSVQQLRALGAVPSAAIQGKTFYLADYPAIDVASMAEQIRQCAGAPPVRQVSMGLLTLAAASGDLAKRLGWKEPPLTSFRLANLVTNMVHDLVPLQQIVGPLTFDMPEGVRRTVAWMRAHGELP